MEPYTLNRSFLRQQVVDEFNSIIWTERYYGDSEVEIVVPATVEMAKKLPVGTFLSIDESDEVMILENWDIKDGNLKLSGMSLLPWLDNRFIRTSANHEDRYWYLSGGPAGWALWAIVWNMISPDSPYLNGTIDIGIPNPEELAILGVNLIDYDKSGPDVELGVPFGPIYNALKEIATTYEIGIQATLESATDSGYSLGFRSYKGLNRTSGQTENPVVRFSPQMDSLTDIKELQSIAALKTLVYAFAPGLKPNEGEPVLTTIPGVSRLAPSEYVGFDLRALLVFADDITTDKVAGSQEAVVEILNSRAHDALTTNHFIKAIDGEIVPDAQFQYGVHYNLGDIIEVQGYSEIVQTARVTEYIRSQDEAGERAYPTVSMISTS